MQPYFDKNANTNPLTIASKRFVVDNQLVERKFYRLIHTERMQEIMQNSFGDMKQNGKWFRVLAYVVLDEEAYVLWKLYQ
jgi:hypothetical protein